MPLDIDSLKMKVAELQQSLEQNIPGYIGVLKVIHDEFKQQPELLYRLEDEEIASVISGLEKMHKVEVKEPKEKKPISKKQGNLLSADDV